MYNLRSRDKEDRSIISEKDDDSVCEAKPSRSHTSALRKSRKVAEVLFEIQADPAGSVSALTGVASTQPAVGSDISTFKEESEQNTSGTLGSNFENQVGMGMHSLENQFSRFNISNQKPCIDIQSVTPADNLNERNEAKSTSQFNKCAAEETKTFPTTENHPLPDKREIDGQEVCEDVSERVELSEAAFAGKNIGLVKFNRLSAASQQEIKDWCVEMMNEKHQKEIQRLQKENFDENEKHQKEIQRLQKENFDKQFIRASELVGMPQRVLTYKMKKNGGTVSATARTPLGVVVWVDFYQLQRRFAEVRQPHFRNLGFILRVNEPPSQVQGIVYCEKNLQTRTEEQLFIIVNQLCKDPESETFLVSSAKESCGIHFQCSPDGVTVLWQRDPVSKEAKPVRATNCWENKPEWIFEKGSNVSQRYNEEVAAGKPGYMTHLVEQVVGNMCAMGVSKACINTGVHMIGMKLTDDGIVNISPAVSCQASGFDSAWHFIDFMLNSPEASKGCTEIPILPESTKINAESQPPQEGSKGPGGASGKGQGAAKGKENKPTQTRSVGPGGKGASLSRGLSERPSALNVIDSLQTKPPSKRSAGAASSGTSAADGAEIQYLHKLDEKEDRVVWRAKRRETALVAWTDVVIKCYRTEPEYIWRYEKEVACYRQAASMQGVSIAELLRWDMEMHMCGEARPRVGLMVSWVGGTYDVLPPAGLARAREIVEGLHRLGVVHGDVACHNMSYAPKTGRVVLFDFSEGGTRAGFDDEAAFESACGEDLERLDEEMQFVAKHPEMCRLYV